MYLKKFVDTRLPWLASTLRVIRDQRLAAKWRISHVPLGFEMVGPPGMAGARSESEDLTLFLELTKNADAFIDIGANCGLFTLAARHSGLRGVAIEPNLENVRALLLNLTRNDFTDIEVFPVALSREVAVLPLYGGQEGASLRKGWSGISGNYSRLTPVNTIDTLFGERFVGKRLIVKLDVEGNEYDTLLGAAGFMARSPAPVWIVEHGFRENFSEQINPRFRALFELFWKHGYQCFTADSARRPVSEDDVGRWLATGVRDFGFLNYLFLR